VGQDDVHELTPAYALDALDERERVAYEAHLETCEACRAELADFQDAATSLAYALEGPAPSPELRERILVRARGETTNVVQFRRRLALPVAATLAVAAACTAVGLGLWAASLNSELDREREALAVLADPQAARVPLEGATGSLVVTPAREGALVLAGLEPAPEGKLYEAWVSADGETMLPAGTFEASGERTIVRLTRPVPPGGLVAVTVEDEPVDSPTGEPVFSAQAA
jgi:anti-sigma factor RsiW